MAAMFWYTAAEEFWIYLWFEIILNVFVIWILKEFWMSFDVLNDNFEDKKGKKGK